MTTRLDPEKLCLAVFLFLACQGLASGEEPSKRFILNKARAVIAPQPPNQLPADGIYLIEDLHGHPEAQKNILYVLNRLTSHFGAPPKILVEGSTGRIDLEPVRALAGRLKSNEAIARFTQLAKLSGDELFALSSDRHPFLNGAEDPKIYEANLEAFRDNQSASRKHLQAIERSQNDLWNAWSGKISDTLRGRLGTKRDFDAGRTALSDYVRYLRSNAESEAMSLSPYPQMRQLIRALHLESRLDPQIIANDLNAVLEGLSRAADQKEIMTLVRVSLEIRLTGSPTSAQLRRILTSARSHGMDGPRTERLDIFEKYLRRLEQIGLRALFQEMEAFSGRLILKACRNPREEQFIAELRSLDVLKRVAALQAAPADYQIYTQEIRPGRLAPRFRMTPHSPGKRSYERFYSLAIERNDVLATAAKETLKSGGPVVLILGGFHTSAVRELLMESSIPVYVITPRFSLNYSAAPYEKVLLGESTALGRILSGSLSGLRQRSIAERTGDFLELQLDLFEEIIALAESAFEMADFADQLTRLARRRKTQSPELLDRIILKPLLPDGIILQGRNFAVLVEASRERGRFLERCGIQPDEISLIKEHSSGTWSFQMFRLTRELKRRLDDIPARIAYDRAFGVLWRILERYSNVHRGLGQHSQVSTYLFDRARYWIAQALDADPATQEVILSTNAHYALTSLAHNLRLEASDAVISDSDGPWNFVKRLALPQGRDGRIDLGKLEMMLKQARPRLICITQPRRSGLESDDVPVLAGLARNYGARLMVDASAWPLDSISVKDQNIDFLIYEAGRIVPFAPAVIVARRDWLKTRPDEAPYEVGGGTKELIRLEDVIWGGSPDKFEVGSPNIPGTILLGSFFKNQGSFPAVAAPRPRPAPRALRIEGMRAFLAGREALVPVRSGQSAYVNFDNAASTPTFSFVFSAIRRFALAAPDRQRRMLDRARGAIMRYFGAPKRRYDLLSFRNTSEAINYLSHNLESPAGAVVVNSLLEHNSNELPWRERDLLRIPIDENGFMDLATLERWLDDYNGRRIHGDRRIGLVAVSGASNVLGSVNDVARISKIAHRYGALLFVDAAQLAAHRAIDMTESGIDFLAYAGHKMYAPFGHGGLIVRKGLLKIRDRDHAGSPEGMIALAEILKTLSRIGLDQVAAHEEELLRYALRRFRELASREGVLLKIHGIDDPDSPLLAKKTGVIAFNMQIDPRHLPENLRTERYLPYNLVSAVLAEEGGIGVRAGCFCADLLIQRLLNITDEDARKLGDALQAGDRSAVPGTTRMSFGIYNTLPEIDRFFDILTRLAEGKYDLSQYELDRSSGEYFTRDHLRAMEKFMGRIEETVYGTPAPIGTPAVLAGNLPDETTIILSNRAIEGVRTQPVPSNLKVAVIENSAGDSLAYAGNLIRALETGNRLVRFVAGPADRTSLERFLKEQKPDWIILPHEREDLEEALRRFTSASGKAAVTYAYVSLDAAPFQNLFYLFPRETAVIVRDAIRAHRSQVSRTAYDEVFFYSSLAAAQKVLIHDPALRDKPHAQAFRVGFIRDGRIDVTSNKTRYSLAETPGPQSLALDPEIPVVVISPHSDDLEIAAGGLVRSVLEDPAGRDRVRVLNWIIGTGDEWGVQFDPSDPANRLPEDEQTALKRGIRKEEAMSAAAVLSKDAPGKLEVELFGLPSASQFPLGDKARLSEDDPLVVEDIAFLRRKLDEIRTRYTNEFSKGGPLTVVLPHPQDDHPHHQMATRIALRTLQDFSASTGTRIQLLFYSSPWSGRFNTYFVSAQNHTPEASIAQDLEQKLSVAGHVKRSLGIILGELVAGFGQRPLSPEALGGQYAERFMRKTFVPEAAAAAPVSLPEIGPETLPSRPAIRILDTAA